MPRITITVSDELNDYLEEKSGDGGDFGSKSEVMRHLAERGREAEDLEQENEILENRIDELHQQLAKTNNVEERVDVLAKRIEDDRQARDAPFFVRWGRWAKRAVRG